MDDDHILNCLAAICDEKQAENPVAWFDLEQAGFSREDLKKAAQGGDWIGPKPHFEKAPDRQSDIWMHMLANEGKT